MGDLQNRKTNTEWGEGRGFFRHCPKHDYGWDIRTYGFECPRCKTEKEGFPPDAAKMVLCPGCHETSMAHIGVKYECFNPRCRLKTSDPARAGLMDRWSALLTRLFR